ncbi:hypothetical protein HAX54_004161, partial [Datura stramonium]|nr:hypothetical protein [Datura stramonium]
DVGENETLHLENARLCLEIEQLRGLEVVKNKAWPWLRPATLCPSFGVFLPLTYHPLTLLMPRSRVTFPIPIDV